MQDGEPVQKIAQEVQLELEYEERIAGAEHEEDLLHDFVHPFDLGKAPLIRIKAVKIGEDKTVLLLDMHHIISDGMSVDILTNELSKLYNGEQLQPLSVQYKDYSEWMRARDLSEQKKYWQGVFKEPAPVLDLQLDYLRPQTQSFKGHCINGMLTAKQKTAVDNLCRKTGTTAYMVLLSTLMVLLGKYSRQEDIVIGSPISGRTHKDTEQMVGMFVNTLAMRGYPKGDKKVLDFLKEVRESALKAYENQEYPFEELVESVEVRRDLSRNPLFDVMFVLQNNEQANLEMNGFKMTYIDSEHTVAKFDLSLSISETEDGYAMTWEYCTDLLKLESVERMMKHFSRLVDELTANPEGTISELSVVDEEEQRLVIETFNDTAAEYPREKTVVGLFEEQVQQTPDHIAVVFEDEQMSYTMLNEKANQLAYKLRELGVKPDDRVAILAQRSIEMIIGIYGILKAGGAYVPVDPSYPENRIQYMLEDCGPKAILLGRVEPPIKGDIPVIDLLDKEVYSGVTTNPVHVNTPKDLMYVIYTSGTTGKPKGVMIEHESVVNFREYSTKNQAITTSDVVLQFAGISFDVAVYEMTMSLLAGAQLCLCPEDVQKDVRLFEQYIDKHKVTIAILPPQYLAQVDIRQLRAVVTAGSETNQELVCANNKHMKYSNDYGPTEATIIATHWECDPGEPVPERVPIGKPIENMQIYIMNGNDLCGIGMPGELCIAGVGLARGYLNRPELTAEKFAENPFVEGRMYRSGDLARWLPDGNIEYMGRIDEQVKIRGFRVELGEIESVLRKQPGVKEVAVAVKEKNGDRSICAYVVSDQQIQTGDIKDNLRKELPEYMVPAYIAQIESIPFNRNGKLDKHALPEPEATSRQEYISPRNEIEKTVAGVFAEVLGVSLVGIEDNFFEMGGDSIKAIRVVSKIREAGYELAVKDLMQLRIVKLIAEKTAAAEMETVYQGEISGLALLTPIQHTFFDWNYVKPHHFNQATMLYCEEGFHVHALKQSITALVVHHDMLRSVYKENLQWVLPVQESKLFDWNEYELQNSDPIAQIVEQKSTELQSSIDLEQGPLMKVGLFHTADGDHLLLCLHHLVVDGVSWRILLEDLKAGYEQALQGKEVVLPAKTASYKDWAEALVEYSQSTELKQEINYWREICKQIKDGKIQGDFDGQPTEYAHMQLELEMESTRQLLYEAGKAYGTEINDLLLSALGMAVKQWKGQNYVAVEMEGHGREEIHKAVKMDRTVGWFTSVYPIVLKGSEDPEEAIINTKEMLRTIPNHGIGYGVAKYLGQDKWPDLEAGLGFNYLGHMDHELGAEGRITVSNLSCGSSIADENMPKQGITMNGSISGGKLRFAIAYNKGRYSAQSIAQFCQNYVQSIQKIVQHCVVQKEVIKTASDFGALNMNASDFKQLTQRHPVPELSSIYSLTPMQEGMLYHKLADEQSTGYVLQFKLRMKGKLQVQKAQESLSLLARKYDVLRTAFIYYKVSKPWQIVLREREIECNVIDLCNSKEQEKEILKIQQADIRRGFNLEEDSLLRTTILRKSEEEHILLWSSHHIIMDGWSLPLLFQDFMQYYEALTEGSTLYSLHERVREEAKGVASYGEYIRWLDKQDREEGLSYWENFLADYTEAAEILPLGQSGNREE
ncbi:non-ribosomal peptide synthetase [Paenibacillus fonticola]|uniref:non-ribosomal peptide synthetase n=1 Tax=Paenibacillus fonticola TaxID=379896 RepID=UPI0003A71126|nr:non-ribosomal peptide synthetase [Paenibacillus fonticola]